MRKTILGLTLLVAFALQAQTTSRITFGVGGGLSVGTSDGPFDNKVSPMGTFNFNYDILNTVRRNLMVGFRTGVHASYAQLRMTNSLKESFPNVDYYGHRLDYTVRGDFEYKQKRINIEVPLMFTLDADRVLFSFGTKVIAPLWNKYTQTISDPVVSAYYGDYGVTVVNDVATGIITDEQCDMSGEADLPSVMFTISAQIGYTWRVGRSNIIGFDFFVDYVPFCIGKSDNGEDKLVDIAPIINDSFQPTAPVTVNTMFTSNDYKFRYLNVGAKFIWAFDIEHR